MIFFNQVGDEMGGLVFGANGDKSHFGSLTWDKFNNDQTIGFRHLEGDSGTYETGLAMWQQPNIPHDVMVEKFLETRKIANMAERQAATEKLIENGEYTAPHLFLGKRRDNSSELLMSDTKGKPRLRIAVAPDGTPKLEFLDESGKVTYSLPAETKAVKK